MAVMWDVPAGKLEVVYDAEPPDSGTVARTIRLRRNVTFPVGVPLPLVGRTVAVKVTGWPEADGFEEDTSDVEVEVGVGVDEFTVCVSAGDVEAAKAVSPE